MCLSNRRRPAVASNTEMSASMTERFSVSGALLVTLFGRLADEGTVRGTGLGRCATSRSVSP